MIAVDLSRPLMEVHRFGSLGLESGKALATCKFRPAYIDPGDGKQVFTKRPVRRLEPSFDIIEFADIIERDFYLTNREKLPDAIVRAIQALP